MWAPVRTCRFSVGLKVYGPKVAQAGKAPIQRMVDRVSAVFVPVVLDVNGGQEPRRFAGEVADLSLG